MKFNRKIRRHLIWLAAISLISAVLLQEVHAGATASINSSKQCVQRDGLTFNGVGLWTRLPTVLKLYGQPLRIEPMEGANKDRIYGNYYYKDIKLLIFNSIVWQINVLTPEISTRSGIRLLSDVSEVEKMLGVKLKNPPSGQSSRDKHRIPICPPDPPEVEEYVILRFDHKNQLVEFALIGVFP